MVIAILLGLWGDLRGNARILLQKCSGDMLKVGAVLSAWAVASGYYGSMSTFWIVVFWLSGCLATGAAGVAGRIFTLVIVRMVALPACMPAKLFSMLTGQPEDALDEARARMHGRGWRQLPAQAADGVSIDSMVRFGLLCATLLPK